MPRRGAVAWNKGLRGSTKPKPKGARQSALDALAKKRLDRKMTQARKANETDAESLRRMDVADSIARTESEVRRARDSAEFKSYVEQNEPDVDLPKLRQQAQSSQKAVDQLNDLALDFLYGKPKDDTPAKPTPPRANMARVVEINRANRKGPSAADKRRAEADGRAMVNRLNGGDAYRPPAPKSKQFEHNFGDPVTVGGSRGAFASYEDQPDGSRKAVVQFRDGSIQKVDPADVERDLAYADSSSPSQNARQAPARRNPGVREGDYFPLIGDTVTHNGRQYKAVGANTATSRVQLEDISNGERFMFPLNKVWGYRRSDGKMQEAPSMPEPGRFAHPVVGPDRPAAAHEALSRLERAKAEGLDTRAALQGGEAERRWKQIQSDAAHYSEYGSAAAAFDRMGSGSSAREIPGAGGKAEADKRFGRTGVITSPLLDAQKKSIQDNVDAARASSQADYEARKKLESGPTLAPATVSKGTWVSPRGTLLTEVEKVDTDLLGKMYAAETASLDTGDLSKLAELRKQADTKTEYAFSIGYRNPRVPETPDAYAARTRGAETGRAIAASEQQVADRARQSDVRREFEAAGNDFNAQRKLVAKYAAEGRATYVPAGARGNSTAEVHVDGVKVGQASSLVDPKLVAEEPGKSTYGERKLVPNGSVPDPYSRPAAPSATPDAPFAQQVSSMTDSKLEYYRKFYNGRTDSISVQNGNAVRAELDRRKAAANKPPTAMEQQRAAVAKMDADAAAGIGKVDFGAPGGPSPRITRENADEVIAAQKANLERETEFYNKKGVGGSYQYSPSSRKQAKQRIADAKRNIANAERVKAGGAVRPAKRGELVVFVGKSSTSYASGGTVESPSITIGEVTSVDRLGIVKAFRPVDYLSSDGSAPRKMDNASSEIRNAQQLFISPDQIDIAAAKEYLRSNGYMPFASVDEVKNALRQFRVKPGDAGRAEARKRFR